MRRVRATSQQLILFAGASLAYGIGTSIFDSTFNNFLNEKFSLSGFQRSFLEIPRELPGFLVVFVSAGLWFLCSRRLGAVANLLGAAGALLIGFFSHNYALMTVWLFIYSLGGHLNMPVASTIGMELATAGRPGRRLGQLNSLRNFATILGSFVVFLGFKYLGFDFTTTFSMTALALLAAAGLMAAMTPQPRTPSKVFLHLHREYRLFYLLSVFAGSRKQIFITFAPWVLVTVFDQPTQIIATLLTIGGVIGIVFQPLLGWSIDRCGERPVLVAEAVVLVFICFGYGYAKILLPESSAFLVVCGCYLVDQMIFSVSMARSTYMQKIARQPVDVQP
ncbi:MAG: hypothetical protein A2Z16_05500, partial [Chloroflexi bacterium RBG_16_54_18]